MPFKRGLGNLSIAQAEASADLILTIFVPLLCLLPGKYIAPVSQMCSSLLVYEPQQRHPSTSGFHFSRVDKLNFRIGNCALGLGINSAQHVWSRKARKSGSWNPVL